MQFEKPITTEIYMTTKEVLHYLRGHAIDPLIALTMVLTFR